MDRGPRHTGHRVPPAQLAQGPLALGVRRVATGRTPPGDIGTRLFSGLSQWGILHLSAAYRVRTGPRQLALYRDRLRSTALRTQIMAGRAALDTAAHARLERFGRDRARRSSGNGALAGAGRDRADETSAAEQSWRAPGSARA